MKAVIRLFRFAVIAFLVVLTAPALAQVTGTIPPTPALKRAVTVASDLVRIGDLVENAGAQASVAIFRAPDLGQTGTVEAYKVIDAIRAHGLILVDTRGLSDVAVTRASRVITRKDIERQIARAVAAQHGYADPKNLVVSFEGEARPIQAEPSAAPDLQLARLFYDPRTGRFDIYFDAPGGAAARRAPLRYVGTIVETVEAAILLRPLNRGEVVKAGDLATERRPKAEVATDVLGGAAQAAGLAARYPLRAGQPLRAADLMKPELVQRHEPVTLLFEAPGMMLTIRGKALESGAEGDLINVVNLQSKRTVQGIVTGPNRVTVASIVAQPAPSVAAAPPSPITDVVP